jgi:hypothetical protein
MNSSSRVQEKRFFRGSCKTATFIPFSISQIHVIAPNQKGSFLELRKKGKEGEIGSKCRGKGESFSRIKGVLKIPRTFTIRDSKKSSVSLGPGTNPSLYRVYKSIQGRIPKT